jgi:hypothetical protein
MYLIMLLDIYLVSGWLDPLAMRWKLIFFYKI